MVIMGQEIAQGNERKVVVVLKKEEEMEVEAEVMVIKVTVVVPEAFGTKTFRKTIWHWFVGGKIKLTMIIHIHIHIYIYIIANLL